MLYMENVFFLTTGIGVIVLYSGVVDNSWVYSTLFVLIATKVVQQVTKE